MQLEHDTWVVVADGEKYLLMRNKGDGEFLHLEVVDEQSSPNAPDREASSDRPGRQHDSARQTGTGVDAWGKSAMEETDTKELAEARFASDLVEKLSHWAMEKRFQRLVVVADPRSLGRMRANYGDALRSVIQYELDKDLTNAPLDKIEAVLKSARDG